MMNSGSMALGSARAEWPVFGLNYDVRPHLAEMRRSGLPGVLATLFRANGGSARGLGSQMIVSPVSVAGYMSGGCIEADVTMHALETLASGQPRRIVYGQGGPVDIVLPCGGSVEILLEPIDAENVAVENLLDLHARRLPAMWLTNGSKQECLAPGEAASSPITLRGSQALCGEAGPGDDGFIYRRHDPRRRLIVVGSDPICLALIDITRAMEFDVVLLRPKGPPSPPPNFAGQYMTSPAALALDAIGLDAWTSVVVATHDPINDHDALLAALPSAAGYVGLLGARRRLKEKLVELSNAGVADRDLQRLNAPIGLDIGGRSPWDIAISILGQVIQNANAAEKSFVWP